MHAPYIRLAMLRTISKPVWRVTTALVFFGATLIPGVCGALCATHLCPSCTPAPTLTAKQELRCPHCSAHQSSNSAVCDEPVPNCCTQEKSPVYVAARPSSESNIAQGTHAQPITLARVSLLRQTVSLRVRIPTTRSGAPPGGHRKFCEARAPPIPWA